MNTILVTGSTGLSHPSQSSPRRPDLPVNTPEREAMAHALRGCLMQEPS